MALSVGTSAPDFTLQQKTADGLQKVTLSKQLGDSKVVLLFFPFAFTGVCQEELCSVSGGLDEYASLGAKVFGISTDSPFAQEAFAQANQITVPLLSDFDKEVVKAYDVQFEELAGMHGPAKRSAFVIDGGGKIVYAESSDDPKQLPDFDAIQAALKA